MKIYRVKILFSSPKKFNLISWIIRKRINKPYSHVAIAVYLRSLDFWDVYEASHGTVHIVADKTFREKNTIFKEYNFRIDKQQFQSGLIFLKNQLQKKYSVLGAIAATIPFLKKWNLGNDNDKSFICSELASRYVEEANILSYAYDRSDDDYITPSKFEKAIKEVAQ